MEEFSMILSNSTKLLRFFFLYTFVNWARVHIEDHTLSMIDFIKWLVFKQGKDIFLSLYYLVFFWRVCIFCVYCFYRFWAFLMQNPLFTYQKRKMYILKKTLYRLQG